MKALAAWVATALLMVVGSATAQPRCTDEYVACYSSCASVRSAERCMQRCQQSEQRCDISGIRAEAPRPKIRALEQIQGSLRGQYDSPPALRKSAP